MARVPKWFTDSDGARHADETSVSLEDSSEAVEWLRISWEPIDAVLASWTTADLFQSYRHRFRATDYMVSRQWTIWRIMAHDIHPDMPWENDRRLPREGTLAAAESSVWHTARRMLAVIVIALVVAFIVWIPVEIWGNSKSGDELPAMQRTTTAPPANAQQSSAQGPDERK